MSSPFTDKQARNALKTIVATASGSDRVYSWNVLNFRVDPKSGKADFSDWVAHFTNNSGLVHGWVIRRIGRDTELRNGCEDYEFTYEILGAYEFNVGNETSNSDDTFGAIVDAVAAAFNQGDENGIVEINGYAADHMGFYIPKGNITVVQAGEKLLHLAVGYIDLHAMT